MISFALLTNAQQTKYKNQRSSQVIIMIKEINSCPNDRNKTTNSNHDSQHYPRQHHEFVALKKNEMRQSRENERYDVIKWRKLHKTTGAKRCNNLSLSVVKAVDHYAISPYVTHIRISIITFAVTDIDNNIGEKRILFDLAVWKFITKNEFVRMEIEDEQLRRTCLFRYVGHVSDSSIKNPKSAACISCHSKYRSDSIAVFRVVPCPTGIGLKRWRPVTPYEGWISRNGRQCSRDAVSPFWESHENSYGVLEKNHLYVCTKCSRAAMQIQVDHAQCLITGTCINSQKSKVFAASSLWCTYSKLKTILRVREKVDVSSFTNVVSFLKKMSVRHVPRKSNVLSRSQIDEFLLNAPDDVFLLIKVVTAFGVFGACRRQELHDLCFNDVKVEGSVLVVRIAQTKNYKPRSLGFQQFNEFFGRTLKNTAAPSPSMADAAACPGLVP
ncbi:hypothetical protein C0J52_12238 [Blattella germanica]|nr:hypothetical protein C0J52_12238 [Blattella germanica]